MQMYNFKARLATRLASKYSDSLFTNGDLDQDQAQLVFDALADALSNLSEDNLLYLVHDTGSVINE